MSKIFTIGGKSAQLLLQLLLAAAVAVVQLTDLEDKSRGS